MLGAHFGNYGANRTVIIIYAAIQLYLHIIQLRYLYSPLHIDL